MVPLEFFPSVQTGALKWRRWLLGKIAVDADADAYAIDNKARLSTLKSPTLIGWYSNIKYRGLSWAWHEGTDSTSRSAALKVHGDF